MITLVSTALAKPANKNAPAIMNSWRIIFISPSYPNIFASE
jgi:hypothetical protein